MDVPEEVKAELVGGLLGGGRKRALTSTPAMARRGRKPCERVQSPLMCSRATLPSISSKGISKGASTSFLMRKSSNVMPASTWHRVNARGERNHRAVPINSRYHVMSGLGWHILKCENSGCHCVDFSHERMISLSRMSCDWDGQPIFGHFSSLQKLVLTSLQRKLCTNDNDRRADDLSSHNMLSDCLNAANMQQSAVTDIGDMTCFMICCVGYSVF